MRLSLTAVFIFSTIMMAQTPLEFGIVRDLVGGTPRVSVFSIKTSNVDGENTLQISARAGIQFDCTRHTMLTDSMTGTEVLIQGQICYSASIMKPTIEHFFTVIRENMASFGSGGITQFQIELITFDEMGWLSVMIPISRVDSLLEGNLTHLEFWAKTPVNEVEVGTGGFPVLNASPLPELHGTPETAVLIELVQQEKSHAWKSLILPGWGQMSSGNGVPVINLLSEIAGAALLFTDDYSEVGIGILALNHLISFSDLL
ncbi:MAG: hypothetical protein KAR40_01680 [Candidatus Sabulitectum sp.]|nr:hypothetical protein [Candidatus Sabulitectum sp.]